MDVSICIPTHNEKKALRKTVLEMKETMDKLDYDYEIIIIDDGSTDDSIRDIMDLDVRILRHRRCLGAGVARVNGIKYAQGKYILQTDADDTYPTSEIPEMLESLSEYDMVVGARKYEKAKDWKILRVLMKWIIKRIASYLAESKIPDLNTGLRAYRRDVVMKYIYLYPPSHSIMSTMTLAFLLDKRAVKYVPIEYRERLGKSSFHPLRDTYNYILATTRAITNFSPFRISTKILTVFSLLLIASLARDIYLKNLADTTVLLFLVNIMIFLFGVLFDQITIVRKTISYEIAELKNARQSSRQQVEEDPDIEILKS